MNDMPVGQDQTLSFVGGATHGGGSCQVSVTLDKEPTKDSVFKVIHSIIGGCPADVEGNMSGDASFTGTSKFTFQIPAGMPNGEYTLAWTWFNRIGNREMYMNCAPITVTGGSDSTAVYDALPDMFVANVPPGTVTIPEGKAVVFPNPGGSVVTAAAANLGTSLAAVDGAPVPTPTQAPANTATSVASSPAAVTSSTTNPGGVFAPGASAASSTVTSSTSVAPSSAAASSSTVSVAPAPVAPTTMATSVSTVPSSSLQATTLSAVASSTSSVAPSASPSSPALNGTLPAVNGTVPVDSETPLDPTEPEPEQGSCAEGRISCGAPGTIVCVGTDQIGVCGSDMCADLRPLEEGQSCENGASSWKYWSGRHGHGNRHGRFHRERK